MANRLVSYKLGIVSIADGVKTAIFGDKSVGDALKKFIQQVIEYRLQDSQLQTEEILNNIRTNSPDHYEAVESFLVSDENNNDAYSKVTYISVVRDIDVVDYIRQNNIGYYSGVSRSIAKKKNSNSKNTQPQEELFVDRMRKKDLDYYNQIKNTIKDANENQAIDFNKDKKFNTIEEFTEAIVKRVPTHEVSLKNDIEDKKHINILESLDNLIHEFIYIISYLVKALRNKLNNRKMRKTPELQKEMKIANEKANLSMEMAEYFMQNPNLDEVIAKQVQNTLFYNNQIPRDHLNTLGYIIEKCVQGVKSNQSSDDIMNNITLEEDSKYEETLKYLRENCRNVCKITDSNHNDIVEQIIEEVILSSKLSGAKIEQKDANRARG